MTLLQKKVVALAEWVPCNSAVIIDGTSLAQKVNTDHLSFQEMFLIQSWMVRRNGTQCETIDVVKSQASEEVPVLQWKQEEADGCLLLHASHTDIEGYSSIMIGKREQTLTAWTAKENPSADKHNGWWWHRIKRVLMGLTIIKWPNMYPSTVKGQFHLSYN